MDMLVALCRIDCRVCDAYIATQTNNLELKQKLADDFKKNFGVEKPLSELDCDGCGATGRHIGFCEVWRNTHVCLRKRIRYLCRMWRFPV